MPQPVPIALMEQRNELQVTGSVSIMPSIAASVAYSPFEHFSIQGFGSVSSDRIHYFQGTLGTYWKTKSELIMEILAGAGSGYGVLVKNSDKSSFESDYQLYFIQYNLGQTSITSKCIDYGLGIKTGYCIADLMNNGYYSSPIPETDSQRNHYYLVEPGAFARFGNKRLRTGLHLSSAVILNPNPKQRQMPVRPVTISFNLNYRLGK
jgi:hypothetical protein